MNINDLDTELSLKSKEIFKLILKKPNVSISFQVPEDEYTTELSIVKQGSHIFLLYKEEFIEDNTIINHKYYNFFTKKLKNKLKELDFSEKIELLNEKKYWFYRLLKPFIGNIFIESEDIDISYKINYNSIIINLSKTDYDRYFYYVSYVYKLKQLLNLNKELNIYQDFSIVFDDDKPVNDLYKNLNDNFKDLINTNRNDFDEFGGFFDDDDDDDDDDF